MIRISNEKGLTLDLPVDLTLTIDRHNPLFNDPDKILQDTSYPMRLPMTENNKLFLGMGHLIEAQNSVYSQYVTVDLGTNAVPFTAGYLKYKKSGKEYDATLFPNFAAITSLLKGIRMTEIRTEDGLSDFPTPESFAALMLATAQNPADYPFIFFPVYNPKWHPVGTGVEDWINRWVDNHFLAYYGDDYLANIPYWKLTYVIKTVCDYLNLKPVGDFFSDDKYKNIVINSRKSIPNVGSGGIRFISPSVEFMPNMLISDFLKQNRQRWHLAFDPDLLNGEMTVESFRSIIAKQPVDLSAFISEEIELEGPEKKGYTVFLKSDEQDDAMMATDLEGKEGFPPFYKLVSGNGEEEIALECSTVNVMTDYFSHWPVIKQSVYNRIAYLSTSGVPPDMSYGNPEDPSTLNNFPLRFIKYEGLQDLGGGVLWPFAGAVDLDDDDIAYYRFLNDAKPYVFTGYLPPTALSLLKGTNLFTHRSEGGNYVKYLAEKFILDVKHDSDLTLVKIYARVLNPEIDTKVVIEKLNLKVDAVTGDASVMKSIARVKAYFDLNLHGLESVKIQFFNTLDNAAISDPFVIESPTNAKGTGGSALNVPIRRSYAGYDIEPQLRVYSGRPQCVLVYGKRTPFIHEVDYSYINIVDMLTTNTTLFWPDTFTIIY